MVGKRDLMRFCETWSGRANKGNVVTTFSCWIGMPIKFLPSCVYIIYTAVLFLQTPTFLKCFWWTHVSYFGAYWYPCLWISGDVSSGFQRQSGVCLICMFSGCKCNLHSPRSTSGATPVNLLAASIAAGHFPT